MKERDWRRDTAFPCLLPLFLAPFSFHATREKVTASAGQFFVINLEILYGVSRRQTAKQPIFFRNSRTREQSNEKSGANLNVKSGVKLAY